MFSFLTCCVIVLSCLYGLRSHPMSSFGACPQAGLLVLNKPTSLSSSRYRIMSTAANRTCLQHEVECCQWLPAARYRRCHGSDETSFRFSADHCVAVSAGKPATKWSSSGRASCNVWAARAIGVGAQSTLGGHDIFARIICMKIARKIINIPEFL